MKENLNSWVNRIRQMAQAEDCDPQEVVNGIIEHSEDLKALLFDSDTEDLSDDRGTHSEEVDQRHVAELIAKRMKERGVDAE